MINSGAILEINTKNLIYVNGKPDHKIGNEKLVEHLEDLIRKKIRQIQNNSIITKSD